MSITLSTSTAVLQEETLTPTPLILSSSTLNKNAMLTKIMIGIIALALIGGGVFTWLGSLKKG